MPNIDLIKALIDTYQPGNKGYLDVQRSQDWGFSVCVYGQLKHMGYFAELTPRAPGDEHHAVAKALDIDTTLAYALVYEPVMEGDKCAAAIKLLQRALDDQPSAS